MGKSKNWDKAKKLMKGCTKPLIAPAPSKKTVIKAAVKPKMLTQTKSSPYIPPAKKTTKPNL